MQAQTLPIIDLQPYLNSHQDRSKTAQIVRETCTNVGFFYIKNHGVPIKLQQAIIQQAKEFFKLPKEQKRSIHMNKGGKAWRGYFQLGQEYTSGKIDLKEGLYLGQQLDQSHPKVISQTPLHGRNLFPQNLPQLKAVILQWLQQMARLGDLLLQAISESLGLDRYYFRQTVCKEHTGLLRLFHYPAEQNPDPSLWAVGEHTDYGLLTMLLITDKGLQVKSRQDKWIKVDPVEDMFVINIGDILQRMTKGLYKSTPHRAKNTQGRSRFSVPYFYDPSWDSQIRQIEFEINQDQRQKAQQTKKYKRWDQVNLSLIGGTYGKYLMGKVSKVFPDLAKQNL